MLAIQFWAGGDRTKMDSLLFAMALVDLPKAQQWAAGSAGPEVQDALRVAAAMRMADIDLEEVLGLLPPDAPRAVGMILHIAQRWAADQPEKALRLTEEGIVRARGCDAGERAEALAAFGSLVVRLGQPENGRKLVEEAAEIAARLPLSPRTAVFRGHVARAVAAFDLKRALDLLEPIADRNQRHAWLPQVAAAASVNQSEQSRALWEGLEPFYLSRAKAATACRLAETRPDEALRIVESIEGDESPGQKVEGGAGSPKGSRVATRPGP